MMKSERTVISEDELLLAEKRTSLATIRTGIAVLVLPLSVMGLLVATSKSCSVFHMLALFIPLAVLCSALVVEGLYLITRALIRLRREDQRIVELKRENSRVADLIE